MKRKILIVAAHPDDEVLGCGGTIAKHTARGDTVDVLFMTDGTLSRNEADSDEVLLRQNAAESATKILGVNSISNLGLPDNCMDSLPLIDVIKPLEKKLQTFKPHTIYTNFGNDLNIDHRITHQAVMTACRPQVGCSVNEIYSFEVLSSTEWQSPNEINFKPNTFVNITNEYEKKMSALKCYDFEMREFPHSRSYETVEALAILRGATHGFERAEAFQLEWRFFE